MGLQNKNHTWGRGPTSLTQFSYTPTNCEHQHIGPSSIIQTDILYISPKEQVSAKRYEPADSQWFMLLIKRMI